MAPVKIIPCGELLCSLARRLKWQCGPGALAPPSRPSAFATCVGWTAIAAGASANTSIAARTKSWIAFLMTLPSSFGRFGPSGSIRASSRNGSLSYGSTQPLPRSRRVTALTVWVPAGPREPHADTSRDHPAGSCCGRAPDVGGGDRPRGVGFWTRVQLVGPRGLEPPTSSLSGQVGQVPYLALHQIPPAGSGFLAPVLFVDSRHLSSSHGLLADLQRRPGVKTRRRSWMVGEGRRAQRGNLSHTAASGAIVGPVAPEERDHPRQGFPKARSGVACHASATRVRRR
jgi:hypothetical protein